MGFAPDQIRKMSLWEYMACVKGWNRAQGKGHSVEGAPMSDEAYAALCDLGDRWNGRS